MPLSDFPVLFKADLIFKDFSREPSKLKFSFLAWLIFDLRKPLYKGADQSAHLRKLIRAFVILFSSYYLTYGSDITPYIKIDEPDFGNIMKWRS